MLIESLLKFQRIFRQLIHLFFNPMISKPKALPANLDVEYANYNLFKTNCSKAKENLDKAITADEQRGDKAGVITLYKRAINDLLMALKIQAFSCPASKSNEIQIEHQKLSKHLEMAQERLNTLKGLDGCDSAVIVTKTVQQKSSTTSSFAKKCVDRIVLLKNVNSKFGEEILSTILPTTDIKMRSIEGNGSAKLALEESVVLPSLNPKLFTGLRAPSKGILLFGPPGNGKTMLAKAVANECHSTFFNISAATIMSKWVGDGEKMVQALFQIAKNAQPSIIFIDEVDSMLCERCENENAAARRVKTEFLIQLDGCNAKSNDRILILAATNRPFELDEGILRRFPKRIFIDLPDWRARASMIKRTFQESNTRVALRDNDFEYLASRTEFYSYSDLDALCRTAALIPLRSVGRSQVSKITASDLRPINMDDFDEALQNVKPSLNQENRERLLEFARKYAQIT